MFLSTGKSGSDVHDVRDEEYVDVDMHVEQLVGVRTESQPKTAQRRHAEEVETKEDQAEETRRSRQKGK